MSKQNKSRRKPKFFDFEHTFKATLPEEVFVEFTDTNNLQIRVAGMLAKDIDMELNMFLGVSDVKQIWLTLPCQCRISYDNYGKKTGTEWCEKHVKSTYS